MWIGMATATRSHTRSAAGSEAHARATVLAELGLFALRAAEFSKVMNEATRVVADVLRADVCSVLESAPTRDRFLRRAHVGYRTPTAPAMTTETAGFAAYTLTVGVPVVASDLPTESRFRCPALEVERVVSGICVVIRPPGEGSKTPYGGLFAGSRTSRAFGRDDIEFMESVAAILGSVIHRQRTEDELRKSEERFDLLCKTMRDAALFCLNAEGSVTTWNAPAEQLFGWRAEDVIGKHVSGLVAEEPVYRGVVDCLMRRVAVDLQAEEETFAVRRDGTHFRATFALSLLRGECDRGMVVFVRNLTNRFDAECERARLAAESERQRDILTAVIEQFPAGVVFHEASDKKIVMVSHQFAEMCGNRWEDAVPANEIVPRFPAWFPDGRAFTTDDYAGMRALEGETIRQEALLGRADGTKIAVIDSASPVYDRHGRLVGSVAALTDITKEKEAAAEREHLLEETKRAVCARDDTIAVVSHDLRNPVSVISLAAAQLDLRADRLDAASVRTIAARIQRATTNADKIIGDLLDFARIEMGRLVVEPSEENARDVVAEGIDTFAELARHRGVTIRPSLDDIASVRIRCDRARIVQVLSNLIGNAIKFVSAGRGIDVAGVVDGSDLVVSVHDEGPGLRPEQIAHVFDRYWQADPRDGKQGLGLGLAIVKGIVHAHGGRVWADSAAGSGATFAFALPVLRFASPA